MMTDKQLAALMTWVVAHSRYEAHRLKNGDIHGLAEETATAMRREMYEAFGFVASVGGEPMVPEPEGTPADAPREWSVQVPPDSGYSFGVQDKFGTWWRAPHSSRIWTTATRRSANRKAKDLNAMNL